MPAGDFSVVFSRDRTHDNGLLVRSRGFGQRGSSTVIAVRRRALALRALPHGRPAYGRRSPEIDYVSFLSPLQITRFTPKRCPAFYVPYTFVSHQGRNRSLARVPEKVAFPPLTEHVALRST